MAIYAIALSLAAVVGGALYSPSPAPAPAGQLPQNVDVRRLIELKCNSVTDDDKLLNEFDEALDKAGEPARLLLLEFATPGKRTKPWERGCAWRELARLGDRRVLALVRNALRDPTESDENIRDALRSAGELKDRSALPDIQRFLHGSDFVLRREAIWALGQIDDEGARLALREGLDDPALRDNQWDLVESIGWQRDASAVGRLVQLASPLRADHPFQRTMIDALTRIGTPDALSHVEAIIGGMRVGIERTVVAESAIAILKRRLAQDSSQREDRGLTAIIERLSKLR